MKGEVSTRTGYTTEVVSTDQLRNGDLAYSHGAVFRLKEGGSRKAEVGVRTVYWFKTEVVKYNENYSQFSKHWQDTWVIQGNESATTLRIRQ